MVDLVDLHIHSTHSDGRQTPQEVVDRGLTLGLKAIAITDHDTVSGYVEAAAYAAGKAIEVISGVELSTSQTDEDIHLLGYLIRPDHSRLLETLERFRRIRYERGLKMLDRLADLGMPFYFDEVLQAAGSAPVGRPHFAEVMLKRGYVSAYDEAFQKYIGLGGPAYVPKAKLTPAEAIELVHDAGGMAVMAHPILSNCDELIAPMVAAGLDGIEIYHPTHNRTARKKYRQIARQYGLVVTGGSDSHNRAGRYGAIGQEQVPETCVTEMKARWQN
jgi:predicted metal-dependent phosphoesterase TrpH